ncbi:uncharacterized protein [Euphorbia lathyris]|uniref:uncharacterized protein isoform X1 n=1 Tax=Euphorbia lathyris TaxID=212925 RepID=UPI003313E10B
MSSKETPFIKKPTAPLVRKSHPNPSGRSAGELGKAHQPDTIKINFNDDELYALLPTGRDKPPQVPFPISQEGELLLMKPDLLIGCHVKCKSWPRLASETATKAWSTWENRLKPTYERKWCNLGINELIKMSQIELPVNKNLLYAALGFWSRNCNAFLFPPVPMTVTLRDVLALTGLPVVGPEIPSLVRHELPEFFKKYRTMDSVRLIEYMANHPPKRKRVDHFLFLWTLVCRYIFCTASGKVTAEYKEIAYELATGKKLALGSMLLGATYHHIAHMVSNEPFTRLGGNLWIVQLWLLAYFPQLQSSVLDTSMPIGRSLMSCRTKMTQTRKFFKFFSCLKDKPPLRFTYCFSRLPESGRIMKASTINLDETYEMWKSFLSTRFLHVGATFKPTITGTTTCFELYWPALCARQFGLIQVIPAPPLLPLEERYKASESRVHRLLNDGFHFKLSKVGKASSIVTNEFDQWWSLRLPYLQQKVEASGKFLDLLLSTSSHL